MMFILNKKHNLLIYCNLIKFAFGFGIAVPLHREHQGSGLPIPPR